MNAAAPLPTPEALPPDPVVVGLSGGVDSSVAALLLARAGCQVRGLFMKNWEDEDREGYCASREDLVEAVAAAEVIGIDVEAVNFASQYRERVFARFLAEYRAGRTPNPDVLCNAEIKFSAFLDHALAGGAATIATGHYARLRRRDGLVQLLQGADADKDQSYFLHRLTQSQLARSCFPLGGLRKTRVREIAARAGLANHARKDSTGLCFIGERPFREFLGRYLPAQPGPICDLDGRVIGEHRGALYYTAGQREGLGIGGRRGGPGTPWYVAAKDVAANTLYVVPGRDHPALWHQGLRAVQTHWVSGQAPGLPWRGRARVRHRQGLQECTLVALDGERCEAWFDRPQWAVAPGQSVVFYDGEVCLGGAVIESALASGEGSRDPRRHARLPLAETES